MKGLMLHFLFWSVTLLMMVDFSLPLDNGDPLTWTGDNERRPRSPRAPQRGGPAPDRGMAGGGPSEDDWGLPDPRELERQKERLFGRKRSLGWEG